MDAKQDIILLSKLEAPQIKTKLLYRKRLVDLLSENLDKNVVLICAGAGYGKTTLLSQFLSNRNIPYVYYHLEKSDAEPVVFFSYLIAGIRRIVPEFGRKTETLSHFFNYPQRYLELIVGTFINEIIQVIKQDLYIILEDYHALYSTENINRILNYLLDHLPPKLHLIITSRMAPPLTLSQLRARDEIFELGGQDLKFTKEEIKNLFNTVYSISLKESELEWIEEHLEGWPTSLRLMLQSFHYPEKKRSPGYIKRILDSYYQSQNNLFNYFAQEIYNQESKSTRHFLVECSIFEWLTPGLCGSVTRRKDSAELLAALTTRNAFLLRMPGMGYRFHNLFRDFLYSKLTDTSRENRLYARAAGFYIKEGRLEDALKFYLQAEEYKKAASIIEKIGTGLIGQGRSGILSSYIEQIPKSVKVKRPSLLMNYAQSLIYSGRTDEAKNHCQRAVKLLKTRPRARAKYADALYKLAGIYLNQGKLKTAEKWFKKALTECPRNARLTHASILNSIGSVYTAIGGGYLKQGTKKFQEAFSISQHNGYEGLEASVLNNWAMNEFKAGNLMTAYSKLNTMVELLKNNFSPGCGAGFYNAAKVSLLLGYEKEARAILDSGMKVCNTYSDLWSLARIWEGNALVQEQLGDFKKAKQFIAKALEVYEKLGIVKLIIATLNEMCRINIKDGDLVDAERNLSKLWILEGNRNDPEVIPLLLTEARLRRIQNKYAVAEEQLLDVLKLAQRFKQNFNLFLIHLELSKVFHEQGKLEESISALAKAVAISSSKGYDSLLLREFFEQHWMLHIVRRENIGKKYVMSIVKKSKIDIHWADVFLFGTPNVIIDDRHIEDGAWPTMKSKKLLFYLLLHREEKINQDILIDALWHSASYKSGGDSLRKALQHTRQILKSTVAGKGDFILSGRGFCQISSNVSVWLDTEEFQNLVKRVKMLNEQHGIYEDYLKKALSIYKDGFAIGWYDSWVEEMRRHYQGLYEECLTMMAELSFSKNKFKEAINWYKKLIKINFYNEEYHRKLMLAYSKVKRYREIIKDFERLKKMLKEELDTEPQQVTTALYKSLIC